MANKLNKYELASREDATIKLLDVLPKKRMQDDECLLVCISTQSIPIVNTISEQLNLNYDLLFSEPICAPNNKSCTIGMVSETEEIVLHNELVNSFEINLDFIYGEAHRQYEKKILKSAYKYRKGDLISSLNEKNILLIDQGCDTGLRVMTAIKTVINSGAKSVAYATPIISEDVANLLEPVTDEIYFVHKISNFIDVEFYYKTLEELETNRVLEIINNSKNYLPFQKNRRKEDEKNS
ncbi:MAG: sodium:proton antiporter [Sulfurospirillum sp.]|nr:sodium:proton antiporter [Sulfurospirillum sp.]MBL0703538.1 sodium:proton antiporter [Sulfurospirillum sp.]